MSETRSDTETPEGVEPEPVDAEFEPAPESTSQRATPQKSRSKGTGPLKLALFVTGAALIGGVAGYGTAYVLGIAGLAPGSQAVAEPDPAFEARLTALESATQGAEIEALNARIAQLETQTAGEALRREAFEQLVRDVAGLRQAIAVLEEGEPGNSENTLFGTDGDALAALEQRFNTAIEGLEGQLATVSAAAETAQEAADQVRAALTTALTTGLSADAGGAASLDMARIDTLEQALARLQAGQTTLNAQVSDLAGLGVQLTALQEASVAQADLDQLARRIAAVRRSVTALEDASSASEASNADVTDRATRALAFAGLNEAALRSGEPFAVELAELTRAWPDAPRVDRLLPLARAGAPSLEALLDSFPGDELRNATGAAQTFLGIVRIEREGAEGPAPEIEAHLSDGDLQAALEIVRALDGEAAEVLAEWRTGAEARRTIEVALITMGRALRTQGDAP